jgi:hypothetical protein
MMQFQIKSQKTVLGEDAGQAPRDGTALHAAAGRQILKKK